MSIKQYHEKRNFKQTKEPQGKTVKHPGPLRFVVQRHAASHLHYDFRLSVNGVLKSWAVPKGPSMNPKDKRLAMMVEDHPYAYRTFEGTIPKGNYGAGEVEIWDEGTYEPTMDSKVTSKHQQMEEGIANGDVKFILKGTKLNGSFALVKIKNNTAGDNAWLLIKHKDEWAVDEVYDAEAFTDEDSPVTAYLESKSSNKKVSKALPIKPKPDYKNEKGKTIKPMLCKVTSEAFDDEEWAFEIKWDGYRIIAYLQDNDIKLYSRNGIDVTAHYPSIVNGLKDQQEDMILDGEIVAYDQNGKPSFQLLQQHTKQPHNALVYHVFDLLELQGHDTTVLSYEERKELLAEALMDTDTVKYLEHIIGEGKSFYASIQEMQLEGMIAKKLDSTYEENHRSNAWLKIKTQPTADVVICGYTKPKGGRSYFGSLVIGLYEAGSLVFKGHVGTGFTESTLEEIYKLMRPLRQELCPFVKEPVTNGSVTWIKPQLVAEIKYTELTKDQRFRHPVFLWFRKDKTVPDIVHDSIERKSEPQSKSNFFHHLKTGVQKIGSQKVNLTNLDKIYFPQLDITKGDVIAYYQSISKYILPYLKQRPQSMHRFPNGVKANGFYQKDVDTDQLPAWINTVDIWSESTTKDIQYLICNTKADLAYINNLGCIDFNVWNSHLKHIDHPDYLVLDLDPSPQNTFDDVLVVALAVKKVLDIVKIIGYPKTSGKSGIHIYVPMGALYDYEQVKNFGVLIMHEVQRLTPDLTTLERSLSRRPKNKIYLDYLQNRRGQTLAAPYSIRPVDHATVSMPVTWDEIAQGITPDDFTIYNSLERIKNLGDLFKGVLGKGIDMLKAIELLEQFNKTKA